MKLTLSGPLVKDIEKRLTKAGVYLVSKIRGNLNTSQPYRRTASGRHIGLAPSAPGMFPKKLSGQLQRSITWSLDAKKLSLTVGSNLKGYPTYLQLGTKFMKPRPWLALTWEAERSNVARILTQ